MIVTGFVYDTAQEVYDPVPQPGDEALLAVQEEWQRHPAGLFLRHNPQKIQRLEIWLPDLGPGFPTCRFVTPDLLPRHLDEPPPQIKVAEVENVEASCVNIADGT